MLSSFDPIVSKLAMKYGVKCVIINGKNLNELKNFLLAKSFKGTLIY